MWVAVLAGLFIGAALGALGGGGSILAVPVLVYVAGQTPSEATATSLVAVAGAAAVGVISHARARRVRWGPAAAFAATGVAGAWLGARLNTSIDPDLLLLGFSGLILVAAHRMLTTCPSCTRVGEDEALGEVDGPVPASAGATTVTAARAGVAAPSEVRSLRGLDASGVARLVAAGSAVGFMTGLFGVGGGFVIVPALTLALGMSMPVAIGTSLAVVVGNALIALGFRGVGAVDWEIAVPFTVTMLIGSLAGSAVSHRLPAQKTLVAFAGLLVVVAVANFVAATAALVG